MDWRHPPEDLRDHVILCNASSQVRGILEELHSPEVPQRPEVVLLVQDRKLWEENPRWHPDPRNPFTREHFYVLALEGGAASTSNLLAAGISAARVAVILADPRQEALADARSTLVALSIERINPAVHTIMELISSQNRVHLEATEVNEVVCIEDLAEKLIAQSCVTPGIKNVFNSLLSTAQHTCKIFTIPLPKVMAKESYRSVARRAITAGSPFVVCGFMQEIPNPTSDPGGGAETDTNEGGGTARGTLRRLVLNPRAGKDPGKDTSLAEGDLLVVMAYEAPLPEAFLAS